MPTSRTHALLFPWLRGRRGCESKPFFWTGMAVHCFALHSSSKAPPSPAWRATTPAYTPLRTTSLEDPAFGFTGAPSAAGGGCPSPPPPLAPFPHTPRHHARFGARPLFSVSPSLFSLAHPPTLRRALCQRSADLRCSGCMLPCGPAWCRVCCPAGGTSAPAASGGAGRSGAATGPGKTVSAGAGVQASGSSKARRENKVASRSELQDEVRGCTPPPAVHPAPLLCAWHPREHS
jgi:hypothetical protein